MKSHKKTITVDLYGMPGSGATKAEATADAARKLEAVMDGDSLPVILRFPAGHVGVLSRYTPYRQIPHWQYTVLWADQHETKTHIGSYETRQDAERAMRSHIAQNLIFVVEDHGMSVVLDEGDQRQHQWYIAWQMRYRALKEQGYEDEAIRRRIWDEDTSRVTDKVVARAGAGRLQRVPIQETHLQEGPTV